MDLSDDRDGVWEILTVGSRYVLDTREQTLTRTPGAGAPAGEGAAAIKVKHTVLSRDEEPVPVKGYSNPVPGEQWVLALDLADAGEATTVRHTTPVVSVRRIGEH